MTVTTRFAPSPTGMLHIGGARTALFNLLFARRHNGNFLLRIEDTDKARSTSEARQAILDGLGWLGVTPDEAPLYQSAQAGRHADVVREMLERGTAFRCYATPEELQARRDEGEAKRAAAKDESLSATERETLRAEADRLLAPFRSPWRDGAPPPAPDAPYTVRLKAPDEGERVLDDKVQGRITIKSREIDDLILMRADGSPTYMLAVAVDDHDMGITHIIRGDDHLRNAFRQIPIFEAMGWQVPEFAHVPLIHGSDGRKLSKRHGALATLAYREMGYLPEAVSAYLIRLGWSHGEREIYTMQEAAEVFALEDINKAPAKLDLDKLADVNRHFLRQADHDRLLHLLTPWLTADGPLHAQHRASIEKALPHMKERAATLPDLAAAFAFITQPRPFELNKKARKALKGEGLDRLRALRDLIAAVDDFAAHSLQDILDSYCAAQGLSMGQVGPPLRAALTGGLPAPDLAPVMEWLGRDEVLARLDEQLAPANPAGRDPEEG